MKLWLVSQRENSTYDTYSAMVVAAMTEEDARNTHPAGDWGYSRAWCKQPEQVSVRCIGEAAEGIMELLETMEREWEAPGVILSSYHAG